MSKILERGDIYFFYRPKLDEEAPRGEQDVQRFFVVLAPEGKRLYRLVTIGRKHLPAVGGRERTWGFVTRVAGGPKAIEAELDPYRYGTKTRGERQQQAARPAGEGVYAIVRHGDHTHLAYELELPRREGPVQEELEIEHSASYVVAVKNPNKPSPPQAGLRGERRPEYAARLLERFRDRRFGELDPPGYLDHEGTELLIVGARETPEEELGIDLQAERETQATAEIFRDLKLDRSHHPLEPLFQGTWR